MHSLTFAFYLFAQVMVDLSDNMIDYLPATNFLYWMADVKRLRLSSNRLRTLPDQLRQLVSDNDNLLRFLGARFYTDVLPHHQNSVH